ncbi:MAG: MoaD/ThiS family protein [Burkholderiales bacterium]|nr:MoaD/ThiS family protein [Burkholderiales bacterium]
MGNAHNAARAPGTAPAAGGPTRPAAEPVTVRVSFMGLIAYVTKEKELALEFAGTPTLRGLLDELERRYGADFGARVFRTSTPPRLLQMCTRIFVNGDLVDDKALDAPLPAAPGTPPAILVYLLPAATGG